MNEPMTPEAAACLAEQDAADTDYCVLCDERETAAAPLVATRWGPMHAACAASEPLEDSAAPAAPGEMP